MAASKTKSKTTKSEKATSPKAAGKSRAKTFTKKTSADTKHEVSKKPKAAETKSETTKKTVTPETTTPSKRFRVKRSTLLLAGILLLLIGLAVYYRNLFVVALVNGQPISRLAYIQELERMSGKQALNSIVTKTLILQEARKQNVSVSEEEINKEIETIEKNLAEQGQKLDSVLELQGMTRESLREQIYLQKLIEKMVGKDIKVTEQEVDEYITQNQESLPQDTDPKELRNQVKEQLRQQKLNEQVQAWLQKLQQEANVTYLIAQ